MQILDDLRSEHELIGRVALSFRSFSRGTDATARAARDFLDFFELYAGSWHHDREERVLFPALAGQLRLPTDRGPIHVLTNDHGLGASQLHEMREMTTGDAFDRARFAALASDYTQRLLAHIDAENSVLLPEAGDRLRRAAIADLPSRDLTLREAIARAVGESLIDCYPPSEDADVVRGDGCVMCASFGVSCNGIEREWWNEWEWEELDEHIAGS